MSNPLTARQYDAQKMKEATANPAAYVMQYYQSELRALEAKRAEILAELNRLALTSKGGKA